MGGGVNMYYEGVPLKASSWLLALIVSGLLVSMFFFIPIMLYVGGSQGQKQLILTVSSVSYGSHIILRSDAGVEYYFANNNAVTFVPKHTYKIIYEIAFPFDKIVYVEEIK